MFFVCYHCQEERFMKKLLAAAMAAIICLSLVACGAGGKASDEKFKIGVMQFGEFDALQRAFEGFKEGMEEAGYVDGKNITINYLSAAADPSNCPSIADTLINDKSDLIFAIATPSVLCVKDKTSDIPVVFTAVTDPVQSGIMSSYEGSGTNIAGSSDMNPVKEQIELIPRVFPKAKTVAVMYCSSESNSLIQFEIAKKEIENLGLKCVEKTISAIDEARSAVESLKGVADVIYVPTDNTMADGMNLVSAAAVEAGIPIVGGEAGQVKNGATITFGIDYFELGKASAKMAVDILKSKDPVKTAGSLPVFYQTVECKYSVSEASVKALGIDIPKDIMDAAEVF